MAISLAQDIPKFYTALAEWLSCLAFVLLLRRKRSGIQTALIMGIGFVLLSTLQHYLGIIHVYLWLPGMALAQIIMMAMIWLCCEIRPTELVFFWAISFMFAEFTASVEWQIAAFIDSLLPDVHLVQGILLIVIYASGFATMYYMERSRIYGKGKLLIAPKEVVSAAIIAVGSFLISNISYIDNTGPLSGRIRSDIFYIRTLVDLAGLLMLVALQDRWRDVQIKQELDSIQALLQRQYEQYRQSKDSIELVHRKYHDMKHQIALIRMETDQNKREEYLQKLESGMHIYDTEIKTGSHILDTILTAKQLYCTQNGIRMNVVADGQQLHFIDVMDLCSIFGNALDNAIESVVKLEDHEKRLIKVAVFAQNTFLMIRVENYYESKLSLHDGEYHTTKTDHDYHGYGIKSIRYTVNAYGGSVSIDTRDNWFTLKVLLPIPANRDNQVSDK